MSAGPQGAALPDRLRLWLYGVVLVALLATFGLALQLDAEELQRRAADAGATSIALFVAAASVLTAALVPGAAIAGAAGLLFGTVAGAIAALAAQTIGALIAFGTGRQVGAQPVERRSGARVRRVRDRVTARPFRTVLLLRLTPGLPYTLLNHAAGLTTMRPAVFVAATMLGAAPKAYAYAAVGGNLDDLTDPAAVAGLGVLGLVGLLGTVLLVRDVLRGRRSSRNDEGPAGAGPS